MNFTVNVTTTLLSLCKQTFTTVSGIGALGGVLNGLSMRALDGIDETYISQLLSSGRSSASAGSLQALQAILATPLKYPEGISLVAAKAIYDLFQAAPHRDTPEAVRCGIESLTYAILPTLLEASGIVPSWLTNDLVDRALYGMALNSTAKAASFIGQHSVSRMIMLTSIPFGIINAAFFTDSIYECPSEQMVYANILGALIASAAGKIITNVFYSMVHERFKPVIPNEEHHHAQGQNIHLLSQYFTNGHLLKLVHDNQANTYAWSYINPNGEADYLPEGLIAEADKIKYPAIPHSPYEVHIWQNDQLHFTLWNSKNRTCSNMSDNEIADLRRFLQTCLEAPSPIPTLSPDQIMMLVILGELNKLGTLEIWKNYQGKVTMRLFCQESKNYYNKSFDNFLNLPDPPCEQGQSVRVTKINNNMVYKIHNSSHPHIEETADEHSDFIQALKKHLKCENIMDE